MKKIYIKPGQTLTDIHNRLFETETGDYTVFSDTQENYEKVIPGIILNKDLLAQIENVEYLETVLRYIEKYGEHEIIEQLLLGQEIELEHTDDPLEALQIAVDHIAKEHPFYYEKLDQINNEIAKPSIREIGYSPTDERFVCRYQDKVEMQKVEQIGREFFSEVMHIHFS